MQVRPADSSRGHLDEAIIWMLEFRNGTFLNGYLERF
jgi:hypothetical protein